MPNRESDQIGGNTSPVSFRLKTPKSRKKALMEKSTWAEKKKINKRRVVETFAKRSATLPAL